MQQHLILNGIQTNDQIRFEHWSRRIGVCSCRHVLFVIRQFLVERINDFDLAIAQNLLPVRQTARNPALKDVITLRHLRGTNNALLLTRSSTSEENQSAASSDFLDYLGGSTEICGCHIETNNVYAFTDTEDVARVLRVPSRCCMTQMRLGGKEELESDFGGFGGRFEEVVWVVGLGECCTNGFLFLAFTIVLSEMR